MRAAGALALLAAAACAHAAPPREAATLAAGEGAYQKCYACHSLEGPDPTTQGPSLKGIVGRAGIANSGERRALIEYLARS